MKKRVIHTVISMLLIVCFCAGCGKQFEEEPVDVETVSTDEDLIVVGVSQVGSESVWRTANTNSVQKVFTKENGYFLMFDNARQKQENQMKAIRSFISQQVDYIVFSPITENGWETVLQEAKDAGIPVILMDRQVKIQDTSLYTTWVGSDFYKEGENAGIWLANHLRDRKTEEDEVIDIVVLQGTQGSSSVIGRTEGFQKVAQKHDNWRILEEVDADYTTAKGKEVMARMLRRYANIDVVVSQNDDMTFGAIEAITEAKKSFGVDGDIIVISFDATKQALEMVEQGIISVDVECNPELGLYVEEVIKDLEAGKEVKKEYYVPERVFTKENVSMYMSDRNY